ncbi:MAG: isopentenyl phosphate kinase [Candidatus Hodarchaeales archaeon]|jgi:isopentenyl phosphate kinase
MEIDLILKIGGSSISNKMLLYKALKTKSTEDIKAVLTLDYSIIEQIAAEIGALFKGGMKNMIILTGVGSPGHFTVLRYGLHKGFSGDVSQHIGLLDAQIAVNRLRQSLLEAFFKNGMPVVQVYASSIYESDKMRIIRGDTSNFERFLKIGVIPVISGDMVPDKTMGYSVLSGDQILLDLVKKFRPKKIILGSDVDGLFDSDPKFNPNAQLIPEVNGSEIEEIIQQLEGGDASGQMKGKLIEVKHLLELGFKDIILLNINKPGVLNQALNDNTGRFTRFQ